MINNRKRLFYLCVIASFISGLVFSEEEAEWNEKPSLAIKFDFGNPTGFDWLPKYGGSIELDYAFFRYFSLGGELAVNSAEIKSLMGQRDEGAKGPAWGFTFSIVPQLRIPFHLQSITIIPYISSHLGLGFNVVKKIYSLAGLMGGRVGSKLFFNEHWGMLLEYGVQLDFRNTRPAYLMTSHVSSLGLIYSF